MPGKFCALHLGLFERNHVSDFLQVIKTGNLKLGNASTSLYFSNFQFPILLPKYKINKV